MKRALAVLVVVLAAGCGAGPLMLSVPHRASGSMLAPPGLVEVVGTITETGLPLMDSPSIASDKGTLKASVPKGSIPGHPETSTVVLQYDSGGIAGSTVEDGHGITFTFLPDGSFYDVVEWRPGRR